MLKLLGRIIVVQQYATIQRFDLLEILRAIIKGHQIDKSHKDRIEK